MSIESVWDYPRPPRLVPCQARVRVEFGGRTIADSARALRVLETSHPPTIYFPPCDVRFTFLMPSPHRSWCEWKGRAHYWSLEVDDLRSADAAWSYPDPAAAFVAIRGHVAFHPTRVDGCFVDDERVRSQDGDFYGGWITRSIRGPFKGAPGTRHW